MMNRNNLPLDWRDLTRRHPSAFLLAAQLVSLVLYAVFEGSNRGRALLGAFGVVILLLVVWVIRRSPAVNWIAWVLVIPAVVLSLLSVLFLNTTLVAWSSLFETALYFYAAGSMVAYMMEDYRVTTDEVFAAGAPFTLLAWGFAYAYMACQIWLPGSFLSSIHSDRPSTFLELLSLSFTNLTATGLGDILPVTPFARVLVLLEQSAGIGYVAVVVSRLIGMTLMQQKEKP